MITFPIVCPPPYPKVPFQTNFLSSSYNVFYFQDLDENFFYQKQFAGCCQEKVLSDECMLIGPYSSKACSSLLCKRLKTKTVFKEWVYIPKSIHFLYSWVILQHFVFCTKMRLFGRFSNIEQMWDPTAIIMLSSLLRCGSNFFIILLLLTLQLHACKSLENRDTVEVEYENT